MRKVVVVLGIYIPSQQPPQEGKIAASLATATSSPHTHIFNQSGSPTLRNENNITSFAVACNSAANCLDK